MGIVKVCEESPSIASLFKQSISLTHKQQVYFRTPTDRGMLKGVRLTCQASTFRGLCINCDKVMKSISNSMAAPKHAESRAADSSLATPEASTRVTRKDQLELAREDVKTLVSEKFCHPIIVRLAWHDSGTYDKVASGLVNSFYRTGYFYSRKERATQAFENVTQMLRRTSQNFLTAVAQTALFVYHLSLTTSITWVSLLFTHTCSSCNQSLCMSVQYRRCICRCYFSILFVCCACMPWSQGVASLPQAWRSL